MIFFNLLSQQPHLTHAVMERTEGSVNPFSNFESEARVIAALRKLKWRGAGINNLIFCDQPHTANVHFCPPALGGCIKLNADGLVSQTKGQVLIIKTADCLPVLMYSPSQKQVAALHAGREGLIKGIIENGLKYFTNPAAGILVGIGPHIKKCCYDLRGESREYIKDKNWREYIENRQGKHFLDLTQIALDKLQNRGVPKKNIEVADVCTFCEAGRFFSARKKRQVPDFYKKDNDGSPCFASFIALHS